MTKKTSVSGIIMLTLCAVIWGVSFVAQSEGMKYVGPFTFQAVRSALAALALLPLAIFSNIKRKKRQNDAHISEEKRKSRGKKTVYVGILCGIVLCIAANLQQLGLANGTSSGKSGFITAFYILIVPVIGLFLKKKVAWYMWLCVGVSIVGMYLLCITDGLSVCKGDLFTLGCAFSYAVHIVVIDNLADGLDGITISCIQFAIVALISAVFMFIFETPEINSLLAAYVSLLYVGILSGGGAFTLQIIGQQRCEPTLATIIMSFESVFALIGGIAFSIMIGAPSYPTSRELCGCVLMFAAIIISQLPFDRIGKAGKRANG